MDKKEEFRTDSEWIKSTASGAIVNLYIGPRDGTNVHAHICLSGAELVYYRNLKGEIIVKGK